MKAAMQRQRRTYKTNNIGITKKKMENECRKIPSASPYHLPLTVHYPLKISTLPPLSTTTV